MFLLSNITAVFTPLECARSLSLSSLVVYAQKCLTMPTLENALRWVLLGKFLMHFYIFKDLFATFHYSIIFLLFFVEHSLGFLCSFGGAEITTITTVKNVIGVFALFFRASI